MTLTCDIPADHTILGKSLFGMSTDDFMTVLHLKFGFAAAITFAVSRLSDGEILRLFSLHVICITSVKQMQSQ